MPGLKQKAAECGRFILHKSLYNQVIRVDVPDNLINSDVLLINIRVISPSADFNGYNAHAGHWEKFINQREEYE